MTAQPQTVSPEWLKAQAQRESRIPHDGPAWSWPINKLANDTPQERAS